MILLAGVVLVAAIFLVYAALLYAACAGVADSAVGRRALMAAALCNGPLAAAWLLSKLWLLWPGLSPAATVSTLVALPVFVLFLLRGRLRATGLPFPTTALPGDHRATAALLFLVAVIGYACLRIPLYSNDPLEYAGAAKVLLHSRDASTYPILDTDASGGFYAPWTHPPGFPALIALASLLSAQDVVVGVKVVAAIHFGALAAAAWFLLGPLKSWLAVLVMMAAPAFALGIMNGYVESVRVTSFFGVVAMALASLERPLRRAWLPMSLSLALCGFAHSLGLVAGLWVLPPWLLLRRGPWLRRLVQGLAVLSTQFLLLAPELLSNLRHFGVVVGDRPAIWEIEQVGRKTYFQLFRGLDSPSDRLVVGVLQGFSQLANFGFSYWVVSLALATWAIRTLVSRRTAGAPPLSMLPREPLPLLCAGVVIAYFASVIGLTLLGSVEAIKNARYSLTVQPLIGVLLALAVVSPPRRSRTAAVGLVLLSSLAPSLIYVAARFPQALTSSQEARAAYYATVHPEADMVRELDQRLNGSCALVFRQADSMAYGRHCFRSYLDHRLEGIYTAGSVEEAAERLRMLGLNHVVTPDYPMPELYNTRLGALLADPGRVAILWASDGYRIYRLRPAGDAASAGRPLLSLSRPVSGPQGLAVAPGVGDDDDVQLCLDLEGRGRVEVYRSPAVPGTLRQRILARLQTSRSGYVTGLGVAGGRSWCTLLRADELAAPLQWSVTDNARISAIRTTAFRRLP